MKQNDYSGATPKQYAHLAVYCATSTARTEGKNPVKALNDVRTEILKAGNFDEHNLTALALIDDRINQLITDRWQWV